MSVAVFYEIPVEYIRLGMSTDDGQDVIGVTHDSSGHTHVTVYTPSDDVDVDTERRCSPETRIHRTEDIVTMATFSDTSVDRSQHRLARVVNR